MEEEDSLNARPEHPMPLTLCTFNVKDFFEPTRDKVEHIAARLEQANADVVGLEEVGPEEALEALVVRVRSLGYAKVVGTADKRGIRNALLSRLPIVTSRVHTAAELPFPRFGVNDRSPFGPRIPLRRGIVHARVQAPGLGAVDVLVVHFKSGRPVPLLDGAELPIPPVTEKEYAEGMLRALAARASEALFVRGIVDGVFANDAAANVAVVGDMNDGPASLPVRVVCGKSLLPCDVGIPQDVRFSILHHGMRQQLDHVLASRDLAAKVASAAFLNEGLRDHSLLDPEGPMTPDSDHAPLVVRFA
jgi:endonuclease/exonuclease/phosphatase family metal-dependent hydrolase